jgi:hypothetical protein
MNKIVNSPIFIAIFVIASLFLMKSQMKPTIATEIQAAYEEIIRIAEEGGSDVEKTKAIQGFAKEIATQLKSGFKMGFSSGDKDKKESNEEKFVRLRAQVLIEELKEVASDSENAQSFIFKVTNGSDTGIKQLRINYEYYKDGKLIDVSNGWVSEVKVLDSMDSVSLKESRRLPRKIGEEDIDKNLFDEVKVIVTSFEPIN